MKRSYRKHVIVDGVSKGNDGTRVRGCCICGLPEAIAGAAGSMCWGERKPPWSRKKAFRQMGGHVKIARIRRRNREASGR